MDRPSAPRNLSSRSLRRRRIFSATVSVGLSLPALTLLSVAGCRSDGSSTSSVTSLGPMRWFARSDGSDSPTAGSAETPPVPPPIGRAFVPAPAPAPERAEGSFYGVRRMGAEAAPAESPSWSDRVRGFFGSPKPEEPILKPVPSSYDESLTQRDRTKFDEIALTSGPFEAADPMARPAVIGRHVEPLSITDSPDQDGLPTIVPGLFRPMPVEPAPWPFSPTHHRHISGFRE